MSNTISIEPQLAWARYEPTPQQPWTLAMAAHLYRRAGFGATWKQLQQAVTAGPQRTVDAMVHPSADVEAFNRQCDKDESPAGDEQSVSELRAWWLQRMMRTPHPLLEKMTLFWHGFFAASNDKAGSAALMQRHLHLLRTNALGSFRDLLQGIVHDPAMYLSLEAKASRKARPDDRFPRWLLDTFLPGQYSEKDVTEASRAFTGMFMMQRTLRELAREHDEGTKTFLGREGAFRCDDIAVILTGNTTAAEAVIRKLYRCFISETHEPEPALIAPLAQSFAKNQHILQVVETMLRSNLFFSKAALRQRMKSPVELALGIVNALEQPVAPMRLGDDLARLGQNLLHPPTSRGWQGGKMWINQATLAARLNMAASLLQSSGPYGGKLSPTAVARAHNVSTMPEATRFFADLFLQTNPETGQEIASSPSGNNIDESARRIALAIVSSPLFQLA